ncbi:MAG TPA: AbrB/MazE/SpoVT family DNA-binding domain-containing protein [Planctomycetota bacterium]|nr:AbrB/MazE/SpoVT family DNA-binding domain-containing protein [Planctomycetota bacterium]
MKVKKLVRHGNSLALVIERPVLELLGITEATPIEVQIEGRGLVVRPKLDPDFVEAAAWVFKKYDKTFRELAEFDRTGKRPATRKRPRRVRPR